MHDQITSREIIHINEGLIGENIQKRFVLSVERHLAVHLRHYLKKGPDYIDDIFFFNRASFGNSLRESGNWNPYN